MCRFVVVARELSSELIATICARLAQNKSVRRTLPGFGRLHIDRKLPFLCIYRRPHALDDAGTRRLVKGEASYLIAPSRPRFHEDLEILVEAVVRTLSVAFGAFLIVELWADRRRRTEDSRTFTIHAPSDRDLSQTVEVLQTHLARVEVMKNGFNAVVVRDDQSCPPMMRPLMSPSDAADRHCSFIGLTVPPIYRQPKSGKEFPLVANTFRRQVSLALRNAYFEFARSETTHRPRHYHSLGRRAVVKAVWGIDEQLAAVSNQFDYLLHLTPINARSASNKFRKSAYEKPPEFFYRPLAIDPDLLKRQLYKIPIERVEDPALQLLFEEKRNELELKLTMLRDRDTKRFVYESLQLFGGVEDGLLHRAREVLNVTPIRSARGRGKNVGAVRFAKRAQTAFDFFRKVNPEFKARTQISDDITGLLVSRGRLLIGSDLSIAPSRVNALIAHEVETHLLTYYNGRAQPFRQLYAGLAGYEELQEGLAVLSEYLVGGLSYARVEQLAARVVAVRHLIDGASFIETFRSLSDDFGLSKRRAFGVVTRVFRGGGLTKDAIYFRGLENLLRYLREDGDLEPLFAGKMAIEHVPLIRELQLRRVLKAAPVEPRYMTKDASIERIAHLRQRSHSVLDLVLDAAKEAATS